MPQDVSVTKIGKRDGAGLLWIEDSFLHLGCHGFNLVFRLGWEFPEFRLGKMAAGTVVVPFSLYERWRHSERIFLPAMSLLHDYANEEVPESIRPWSRPANTRRHPFHL